MAHSFQANVVLANPCIYLLDCVRQHPFPLYSLYLGPVLDREDCSAQQHGVLILPWLAQWQLLGFGWVADMCCMINSCAHEKAAADEPSPADSGLGAGPHFSDGSIGGLASICWHLQKDVPAVLLHLGGALCCMSQTPFPLPLPYRPLSFAKRWASQIPFTYTCQLKPSAWIIIHHRRQ